MMPLGRLRAYWLGAVVCMGGFLFGYDSGIAGGVLTMSSFQRDFGFSKHDKTFVSAMVVSLQQLGAFVACFCIWPFTQRLGRRRAIAICSFIFCIGAIMQTVKSHSRSVFYVGRVIAGLGLGGASVVVPMYSSEMTPKEIRGQVGSLFQLMFTLGIFVSYWVDWGVARNYPKTSSSMWMIPVGLQILWAALLGLGMFTLKESARWLTARGHHDQAWESLKWIRADDGSAVQREMEEIQRGVEHEALAREGFHMTEMVRGPNVRRTLTAIAVFTCQQATGATAFAYYGPQYFKLLVGNKGNSNLLLTAIFGAIKVVACAAFILLVADRVGRRLILTLGAIFMAICQISTAAVVRTHPAEGDGTITSSGIATIALIYLFVIGYNFSWGPLPWPYVAEIFPTRTREPGIAMGVASQWLFSFVFTLTTPYMIRDMKWGTFLLWGIFDLAIAAFSWFALTETRGKSLEEITRMNSIDQKLGD
ncbi:MFS sugar transporter-like protein [Piedraia hortae CBS 480.64]|uniref:MFS sugar transporter-like protein n=1 Tax=Piedraia hortae CBS 480.64 TaxID=1314780 RepID=A0A6A7C113_9PEZI|nr:MFS sugar transporter-like protein [Piedraia hortae CBS 480.64]